MSTFRLPHLSTTELFQVNPRQYQCRGFGEMPHTPNYSTSTIPSAQERMALPPLSVLHSRVYASSGFTQKAVVSPAATLPRQPDHSPSKKRVRALPNASKFITLNMLRPHFERPLAEVANIFGICMTLMKKICRKNGVPRWPHRQIRGLRKSIWSIEKALRCCSSEAQRKSYNDHLQKQRAKMLTILRGPASPSSKAAFELVLSEPFSPLGELATPNAVVKVRATPTALTSSSTIPAFQLRTVSLQTANNLYQRQQPQISHGSPKLPSIASLLIKNEKRPANFDSQVYVSM